MIKTLESRIIWTVIMAVSSTFMLWSAYLTSFISNTHWATFVFWLIVVVGLAVMKSAQTVVKTGE